MSTITNPICLNILHTKDGRHFFTLTYIQPGMAAADEVTACRIPPGFDGYKGWRIDTIGYDTNGVGTVGTLVVPYIQTAGPTSGQFYLDQQVLGFVNDFIAWKNVGVVATHPPQDSPNIISLVRTGSAISDQATIYIAGEYFV